MLLVERLLDDRVRFPSSRVPVTVSMLRESEVDEYVAFYPGANPVETRRRLHAGHRCFTVRHRGRLVHTGWATTGRVWIEYLRRHWDLAADEAYVYELFTAPSYRNLRVGVARAAEETRVLRGEGYRRAYAVIWPEDGTAGRHAANGNFRPVGVIGYMKLGRWRRDFMKLDPKAPLAARAASAYWDRVERDLQHRRHYLDEFLGTMKRTAYLDLIGRWAGLPLAGRILKTDLFEEALGSADAFATELCDSHNVVIGMDLSPAMCHPPPWTTFPIPATCVGAFARSPAFSRPPGASSSRSTIARMSSIRCCAWRSACAGCPSTSGAHTACGSCDVNSRLPVSW
jgi:hypothetical protein